MLVKNKNTKIINDQDESPSADSRREGDNDEICDNIGDYQLSPPAASWRLGVGGGPLNERSICHRLVCNQSWLLARCTPVKNFDAA